MLRHIVDDEQRRDRPQPTCAQRVSSGAGYLRRWLSSTIYADIACVAPTCIYPVALETRSLLVLGQAPRSLFYLLISRQVASEQLLGNRDRFPRLRTGKESNMPIPAHISKFLDSRHVTYQSYSHSRAYTAQGTAQAQHLSGKKLAKVVIVVVDDRKMIMAVVPASCRVDLEKLGQILNISWIRLASEEEFKDAFPECELGAMPPLGNIYHLDVWIDEALKMCPTIAFNAGTHAEIIQMSFSDFEQLVHPQIASFGALLH